MTAEIAIINRSAVTLATDSAVTLSVRGNEKIYNCADKLFELSDKDPIGIMVYNNLEYMGIQLEVAVKRFRQGKGNVHHNTVAETVSAFFRFLEEDWRPDENLQKAHVAAILPPGLIAIRQTFIEAFQQALEESRTTRRKKPPDIQKLFDDIVNREISRLEALPPAEAFADFTEAAVLEFYGGAFDRAIGYAFDDHLPLNDSDKLLLRRVCTLTLLRDEYTDSRTGLVFAGFGESEVFPFLVAYETDGYILGRVKKRQIERVQTSRDVITGEVLPFAQREMVDRFLYGIDPGFEQGMEDFLRDMIEQSGSEIIDALPKRMKRGTKDHLRKVLEAATESALESWNTKLMPSVKQKFMQQVQDTVFLMPKAELATLAEELINLTSVKRKFSTGTESVGGPIDVAVISRIDGFVWVRRKHYFDAKLNPRYFHRKYVTVSQAGGE